MEHEQIIKKKIVKGCVFLIILITVCGTLLAF